MATEQLDAHRRYFSIREVSENCGVPQHTLRHWERQFSQLRPVKRKGNRRFYSPQDVKLVRRLRHLLYDRRLTTEGARRHLLSSQNGLESQLLASELAELEQQLDKALELLHDPA